MAIKTKAMIIVKPRMNTNRPDLSFGFAFNFENQNGIL
jgi:hypothetical protein